MRPRPETKPGPPFLLNSVDRFGRQIAPAVMSVSMEIGPRALAYVCFAKMPSGPKMARFSFATAGIRSLHSTKSFCQDPEGFFWAEMWARLRRGYA